jgi:tRNA-splicing ligase RtcB
MIGWWVGDPVPAAVRRAIERIAAAGDVVRVAVMPDVHLSDEVCVGVAVATRERIYPAAIGGDVGCGVDATPLGAPAEALTPRIARTILDGFSRTIPGDRHRQGEVLDLPWSDERLARLAAREGRVQLGTLGSGNHFLELARDDAGELWMLVHSGSRAIGPAVGRLHAERAAVDATGLRYVVGDLRDALLADLASAEAWAVANRAAIRTRAIQVVGESLAIQAGLTIGCSHDHVRREGDLWVHRKGAIPAGEGVPGVIPGSMGSPSYVVEGRGVADALWSSSHGAGRRMSRAEAHERFGVRALEAQMRGVWFDARRARQLVDEAPGAYKDIGRVMRAQRELTRVVTRLVPVLNYKGR